MPTSRTRALHPNLRSLDSAAWNGLAGPRGRALAEKPSLTRRQYAYQVALLRYLAKVNAALQAPRQTTFQSLS